MGREKRGNHQPMKECRGAWGLKGGGGGGGENPIGGPREQTGKKDGPGFREKGREIKRGWGGRTSEGGRGN